MAVHPLTQVVRGFYNKLNVETDFVCRCNEEQLTENQKSDFARLSEDIKQRYYGSGLNFPENVRGKRILDIGCGSGSLVFLLSKLVGPEGYVVGFDITDGLIQTAKAQSEYHWKQWGYDKANFEFRLLNAEQLGEAGFKPEEFDIIVSNGVLCLVPEKEKVFQAAFKLLKTGGQFYLNDVYAEKEPPEEHKSNETLWSLGTTGSMPWDTLAPMAGRAGFTTPYLTCAAPMQIVKEEYRKMLSSAAYSCAGWRLFKLDPKAAKKGPSLVTYKGGIDEYPNDFPWDIDLTFKKGVAVEVDGELATILSSIYLASCFSFHPAAGKPTTNRASGKKQRREQTFRPEYTQRAPCIRPFPQNAKRAWCDCCQVDVKVSHGGWNDVQTHLETAGHERKSAAKNNTSALSAFGFTPEKEMTDKELQVIKAETLFSHFLVEHNLPISASDHAGPLFRAMFPKSEIAQRYGCARTKTTSLLQTCSSTHQDALTEQMKNGPFIIGTDGSQEGTEKFYPIVVRTLTPAGTITTELLANPTCDESATGENIFGLLDRCLGRYDIPWKNCVALMCDNANVMTGRNKGVISYVLRKNSEVHLAGCVCHLLHISLRKGIKASSKFDIDDILRQLHWYITKSTNRHQGLKAHQEACGVPAHAIVVHVPTRWLTMGPALLWILEQWEPLYKFLEEEYRKKKEKGEHTQDAVVTRLRDFFRRRTPKLYVYFYASVIEIFEDTNRHLQSDSARLHTVKSDIDQLFRKLVSGVAKPAAMNQGHIMNIDITAAYNIKKPEGLFIGRGARDHIEAGVDTAEKEAFFKNVVTFYRTACSYITKNLDTR
ncbi:hypothetical protein ACOMHN_040477 [Nucella lapillus]